MIPKLVIANWKMAIDRESVRHFRNEWEANQASCKAKILVAPPAIFLSDLDGMAGVALCGQDVSANEPGAHTGELSAQMLDDFGCSHGLVGHSERRSSWSESDALVAQKALRLEMLQICPVVCVGESKADRESGKAEEVVAAQVLASCALLKSPPVIAYEPVWAIGSGEAATPDIAESMHAAIKATLAERFAEPVPVLYGGSVNESNAGQFTSCESIDGLLVGGASLNVRTFLNICQSVGS